MTADERLKMIELKLGRARKHLRELEDEVRAFMSTEPYKVGTKRDADTRRLIYYVTGVSETPVVLATMTGDVIHNTRSALDHLAYQLVLVGTGQPGPFKRVYFPIADSAGQYDDIKTKETKLMRPAAMAAIDALKPYGGGNDVLWRIHRLDNVDKHRLLLTVGSSFGSVNIGPVMKRGLIQALESSGLPPEKMGSLRELAGKMSVFLKPADRLFPLRVGAELFIDAPDATFNPAIQFRLEVALSEPLVIDGEPILETLRSMIAAVEAIVMNFKAQLQ